MSLTTPSLPAELPPYSFVRLLAPVYGSATSSTAAGSEQTRPTSPSFGSPLGRISQLVSGTSSVDTGKTAVVRSVDAAGSQVWISSSDGRVRAYEANDERALDAEAEESSTVEALELLDEHVISTAKKSLDRLHVSLHLNKAVILSEGQLTFHSLPSFAPLPASAFPTVKGVTAFAVDENTDKQGDSLRICVVKRRSLHVLVLRKDGASSQKDLPLHSGATVVAFRKNHICMADAENYSIVDISAATAIPLMPITQSAGEEPESDQAAEEVAKYIKAHHRPAIACVGTNEFLFASHTGTTTLGVFVNEAGEPCRGTLEWASNVRSLAIDGPHTIALLHNDSIEIHSLQTQEIVQVLSLTTVKVPGALQPRALARTTAGLEVGAASIGAKVNLVEVPLLPLDVPNTPPQTKSRTRATRSVSNASSATLEHSKKKTDAHVLLVCRNGLHALAPSTLIAQVEACFEKERTDEAIKIAEEANACGEAETSEMRYVYMRAAFDALRLTFFQVAFEHLLKSRCDPRLVIRLFPETSGDLLQPGDSIEVPRGVKQHVLGLKTAAELVMDNLRHNYSPHIQPDVESASSTVELKDMLMSTARDCLQAYLSKWRAVRRGEGLIVSEDPEVAHHVDMVVDTVLAKLLVERGATIDLLRLLEGPNDCILDHIEPALLKAGMYHTLAATRHKRGDLARALKIWTSIIDGEYTDSLFSGGPEDIYERLLEAEDRALIETYGIWLIQKQRDLGLRLLTSSKHAGLVDTRVMFGKIKEVDEEAADAFLESVVLQKRSTDASLLTDLIKRYLDRVQELLRNEDAREHIRDTEKEYIDLVGQTSSPPSFAQFLISRYKSGSSVTIDRVRLKALLFLSSTNTYDLAGAKAKLEQLEQSGCRGLTLERATVYGKLQLDRQALSLLLFTLQDMRSVEAYVHQCGNPLMPADVSAAASKLELTLPRPKKGVKPDKPARRQELARTVGELTLSRLRGEDAQQTRSGLDKAAQVVNAYGVHLDTMQTLSTMPDEWPMSQLVSFFERAIRRSSLAQNESTLLKNIAASQNLELSDRLYEKQRKKGPRVERDLPPKSGQAQSQARPNAGSRRKSSAVKIETPLAFKDEGDVVELKPS